MLTKDAPPSFRPIDSTEDLAETRLEAIGYVFHGTLPVEGAKRPGRAGANTLHFARCGKLDRVGDAEDKLWFRSIGVAKRHLDTAVGEGRWKWCKICEREITQKILTEP